MNLTAAEIRLMLELIEDKIQSLEGLIALQDDIVYYLTERGESAEEAYSRIREHENAITSYEAIANKLERGMKQ